MEQCLICCEDFNNSNHLSVSCPWCQFSACRTCCQTYILDQDASVCMNRGKNPNGSYICQKNWTRKFVTDTFPKNWVNKEWKDMNSRVCVEREKALLPATMAVVENRKEIKLMLEEYEFIMRQINILYTRRNNLKDQIDAGGPVITTKIGNLGMKCPDERCRGYLSRQWKCGMCDIWACPDCHVIKGMTSDTEHTCDPDLKATAQLLANDTKSCPKCYTLIHKIDGCDQMWCTQCHTAFSWRRGTIETRIHNPHFYEWERQNNRGDAPRNLGDFECGRDLADRQVINFITSMLTNPKIFGKLSSEETLKMKNFAKYIPEIIRKTIHLQDEDGRRFRTDNIVDNLELRVLYLNNQIDEKHFASQIHSSCKAHEKKKAIADVIQLQVQGVTDIIYRIADVLKTDCQSQRLIRGTEILEIIMMYSPTCEKVCCMVEEINQLTDYSNKILKEHAKTYGCKTWCMKYSSDDYRVLT